MMYIVCAAKPGDHGKIIDITLAPNPPKRESDFTINTTLSLGKLNNHLAIWAYYFYPIYEYTELCKPK